MFIIAIVAVGMVGCGKSIEVEKKINPITNKVIEEYELYRVEISNKPIKHGYYKSYWGDGTFKEVGQYNEGEREGKWISYYPNGEVESESHFKYDMKEGKCMLYSLSGKVKFEGIYRNNIPEKEIYYDENGTIEREMIYQDGKLWEGIVLQFYNTGEKYCAIPFKSGKMNGKATFYYKNGITSHEIDYKDDIVDGKWIGYNKVGNKITERLFSNNTFTKEVVF